MHLEYSSAEVARFDASFTRPDDGCWLWTRLKNPEGYGLFFVTRDGRKRLAMAHRVAWVRANDGAVPDGLYVCHRCNTPSCVRPDHLYAGTPKENARDRIAHGLGIAGNLNPSRTHPESIKRGEAAPGARLTEESIMVILAAHGAGVSIRLLARVFDVKPKTIRSATRGDTWGHVASPATVS
jgi:hypothetical protein